MDRIKQSFLIICALSILVLLGIVNDRLNFDVISCTTPHESDEHFRQHPEEAVVMLDQFSLSNSRVTIAAATSVVSSSSKVDIKAQPLFSTIDRRPITVRRQMAHDTDHEDGQLLGCAFHTNTMVSHINFIDLPNSFKEKDASCSVCLQFSTHTRAHEFSSLSVIEKDSPTTACIAGRVRLHSKFTHFQKKTLRRRPLKHGYPWTVDCELPNGQKQLTCRELSRLSDKSADTIERIYAQTKFRMAAAKYDNFTVVSTWPWSALQTHDDNRRWIAQNNPANATDISSVFVPANGKELQLAFTEGPSYSQENIKGGHVELNNEAHSTAGMNPR